MNRKPVVAGRFYPGEKSQLSKEIENYFKTAEPKSVDKLRAIISPHAGYIFSGHVAASGFNQIDPEKKYERVFILASSHRLRYKGASIYNIGNYETPLGTIEIDNELCDKLISENEVFSFNLDAHSQEHSLEVQLPFLQYIIKNKFKIVPILIGTNSTIECKEISDILKPYFIENNLFVISTDFSHYPDYDNAIETDEITANAIISNNSITLLDTIKSIKRLNINNLSTSLCGWTSVLTLIYITEEIDNIEYKKIQYKNSGDSVYGDQEGVVGYCSIVVNENNK